MKRLFITSFVALFTLGISAQENMEAFSHLAVGVEAGLHGFGIEAAMPVHKSLVVKAGVFRQETFSPQNSVWILKSLKMPRKI